MPPVGRPAVLATSNTGGTSRSEPLGALSDIPMIPLRLTSAATSAKIDAADPSGSRLPFLFARRPKVARYHPLCRVVRVSVRCEVPSVLKLRYLRVCMRLTGMQQRPLRARCSNTALATLHDVVPSQPLVIATLNPPFPGPSETNVDVDFSEFQLVPVPASPLQVLCCPFLLAQKL